MNFSEIIYIPLLHPDLAPENLPSDLLFIDPGLDNAAKPGRFTSPRLPFAPPQARAVLREMLELGSSLSQGGPDDLSGSLRLFENAARPAAATGKALARSEGLSLENFANNAKARPEAQPDETALAEQARQAELVRAQKMLLLAWDLEENLLEIKKAEAVLAKQDQAMLAALRDDPSTPGDEAADEQNPGLFPAAPPMSWRRFLDAAAPFLPQAPLLFSAAPEPLAALADLGALEEMPADLRAALAARPDFAPLLPALRFGRASLRDLVPARKAPNPTLRPWLDNVCNFLLLTGQDHV